MITEHDHHDVTNGRYQSCARYLLSLTLNIINVSKYSKYCVTGIIIHSLIFTYDLETNIEMVGWRRCVTSNSGRADQWKWLKKISNIWERFRQQTNFKVYANDSVKSNCTGSTNLVSYSHLVPWLLTACIHTFMHEGTVSHTHTHSNLS